MDTAHATLFAPAERVDREHILKDADHIVTTGILEHVTRTVPCLTLVLNRERQAVYVNDRLIKYLGASSPAKLLGQRPGELLDCIHASETPGGCGTTAFCRYCGAARAIVDAQRERREHVRECRVTTTDGRAHEFRVWATPLDVAGEGYSVFSLLDISDEKRRRALERTFFHDVNDTLTVVTGYSQLLQTAVDAGEIADLAKTVAQASAELGTEIASHWRLLQAEEGELSLTLARVESLDLVDELCRVQARRWRDRSLITDDGSEAFVVETDRALLQRVLYNMIKNAIEACAPDGTVRIGCRKLASRGVFWVYNPGYMSRAVQLQVFTRSFSTKGEGRGVGTYSMRLFGEQHLKGKVWFTSTRESGTTFFISLPLGYYQTQGSGAHPLNAGGTPKPRVF